jgi:hypothetical protein
LIGNVKNHKLMLGLGFTKKLKTEIRSLEEALKFTRKKVIENDTFFKNRENTLVADKLVLNNRLKNAEDINKQLNNRIAVLERLLDMEKERNSRPVLTNFEDKWLKPLDPREADIVAEHEYEKASKVIEEYHKPKKKVTSHPNLQAYYDRKKNPAWKSIKAK